MVPPFLVSLYDILNNEDPRIIGWCEGGDAFGVHNTDTLVKRILPRYFRHNKLASFQRQLNYFGFRKRQKINDADSTSYYYSPHFVRQDPARMTNIKRKTYRPKNHRVIPVSSMSYQPPHGFLHDKSKRSVDSIMPIPFEGGHQQDWSLSSEDLALLLALEAT
ncbi:hypothetical protein H257_10761 [Aphanomyces astaci]|uniref:HSF-type DNA-binding domain-containing protein n=1 Tax=Aphanomyces astaci TaxID=112090 RepID=W4G6T6_APHAT|nr:hypothetical protein H257_10761 [Aphanomyces astaci]ETV74628.1 hypothetical protein H257_10761 [Aphanomyces astaci]RQM20715.1 hypothetical protein B5M09_003190 [Aphanomyces astaci]|eukprot:XP_009835715.1 hypothetical protein H257_10761 [Aphanomyces astaci]